MSRQWDTTVDLWDFLEMEIIMADKRDYYEVLGVDKNADDAALKKSVQSTCEKISS